MTTREALIIVLLLTLLSPGLLTAEDFGKEGSRKQMEGLSDLEKVHFINKNFYKLYSADFSNSSALAKWAAEVSSKNFWKSEEAHALLGWGVITFLSGDYPHVLPKFFRSRNLFDSLRDKSGMAAINNEMFVFYHKTKDFENAFKCLDAAERNAREATDMVQLGTSLGHRGTALSLRGKYKEAEPYYKEVYAIRKASNDSVGLGYVLLDLGELALNEGKLSLSFDYIDQSTAIRKKIGDHQGVVVNCINRGENYFRVKQYQKAVPWFQSGLDQALALGYADLVRHTYDYLSKTHLALNEHKKAFEFLEKASAYKDSLFNIERTKVIQEMQTKYDAEKKDRLISELNKDNELKTANIERNYLFIGGLVVTLSLLFYLWRYRNNQKQKGIIQEQKVRLREAQINTVIESQEQERKRFASDLHDGMGQMISALQLNIQSIKQSNDLSKTVDQVENSEQLLGEIQDEIRNIAFNLMPPILVKEGLAPAVRELIRRLNKTDSLKVELAVHDVQARFSQVVEISIYRILQELLSNIVKHSKASAVTVSFTGYEEEVVLTLEDNGEGYDLVIFQTSEHGNGWRTIQTRMNLIRGQIEFDTVKGRRNNTVILHIPLSINRETLVSPAFQNT